MQQYNYDNTINTVTNVIMSGLPPARFVHPGAPQLTISYYFYTRVRT